MKRIVLILCSVILILEGCSGRNTTKKNSSTQTDSLNFGLPSVPGIITEPEARLDYLMEHFWDALSSSCYASQVEEQFANWLWMSEQVPLSKAGASLKKAYGKDPERILNIAEKYLYDPISPYRNEDLFGILAASVGGEKYEGIARRCALNAVGSKATDFRMVDRRGRDLTLYGIEAEYVLIFFSNPGCTSCKQIIELLSQDELIGQAVKDRHLKVLSVYIDEDMELWQEHIGDYPKEWIVAYDPLLILRNMDIYNIRAIPSLYLLDKDKTVLLKDAPEEKAIERLRQELTIYYGKF
ncbi:MAG: DUF5106 domain-containing protein [Candidatus Cryptobacteroides sp.]